MPFSALQGQPGFRGLTLAAQQKLQHENKAQRQPTLPPIETYCVELDEPDLYIGRQGASKTVPHAQHCCVQHHAQMIDKTRLEPFTEETQNFFRICALLLEEGNNAIRNALHDEIKKMKYFTLCNFLTTNKVAKEIERLLKRKILTHGQLNQLYPNGLPKPDRKGWPTATDFKEFDTKLLALLWDVLSTVTDSQVSGVRASAIRRLKRMRDSVFANIASPTISQKDFVNHWTKLKAELFKLEVPEAAVDKWEKYPLSPGEIESYQIRIKKLIETDAIQKLTVQVREELEKIEEMVTRSNMSNSKVPGQIRRAIQEFFPDYKEETFKDLTEKIGDNFSKRLHDNLTELRKLTAELGDTTAQVSDLREGKLEICEQLQTSLEEIRKLKAEFDEARCECLKEVEKTKQEVNMVQESFDTKADDKLKEFHKSIANSIGEMTKIESRVEAFTEETKHLVNEVKILVGGQKIMCSSKEEWPRQSEIFPALGGMLSEQCYSVHGPCIFNLKRTSDALSLYNVRVISPNQNREMHSQPVTIEQLKRSFPTKVVQVKLAFKTHHFSLDGIMCDMQLGLSTDKFYFQESKDYCHTLVSIRNSRSVFKPFDGNIGVILRPKHSREERSMCDLRNDSLTETCENVNVASVRDTSKPPKNWKPVNAKEKKVSAMEKICKNVNQKDVEDGIAQESQKFDVKSYSVVRMEDNDDEWVLAHSEAFVTEDPLMSTDPILGKSIPMICIAAEWGNLRRVLSLLREPTFFALIDIMQQTLLLSFKEGNLILLESTREGQLRRLLALLQSLSDFDYLKFAALLCRKRETYTLGSQLGFRFKQLERHTAQHGHPYQMSMILSKDSFQDAGIHSRSSFGVHHPDNLHSKSSQLHVPSQKSAHFDVPPSKQYEYPHTSANNKSANFDPMYYATPYGGHPKYGILRSTHSGLQRSSARLEPINANASNASGASSSNFRMNRLQSEKTGQFGSLYPASDTTQSDLVDSKMMNSNSSNAGGTSSSSSVGALVLKIHHTSASSHEEFVRLINEKRALFEQNVVDGVKVVRCLGQGLQMLLSDRQESALKHLKLDVESGAFGKRYVEWLRDAGSSTLVPFGECVRAVLRYKGEILVDCMARVCQEGTEGETKKGAANLKSDSNDVGGSKKRGQELTKEELAKSEREQKTKVKESHLVDTRSLEVNSAEVTPSEDTNSIGTRSKDTSSESTHTEVTSSEGTSSAEVTTSKCTSSECDRPEVPHVEDTSSNLDTLSKDTSSKDTCSKDTSSESTHSEVTSSKDTSSRSNHSEVTSSERNGSKVTRSEVICCEDIHTEVTSSKGTNSEVTRPKVIISEDTHPKCATTGTESGKSSPISKDNLCEELSTKEKEYITNALLNENSNPQTPLFQMMHQPLEQIVIHQFDQSDQEHLVYRLVNESILTEEDCESLMSTEQEEVCVCERLGEMMSQKPLEKTVGFVAIMSTIGEPCSMVGMRMWKILNLCRDIKPDFWTTEVKSAERNMYKKLVDYQKGIDDFKKNQKEAQVIEVEETVPETPFLKNDSSFLENKQTTEESQEMENDLLLVKKNQKAETDQETSNLKKNLLSVKKDQRDADQETPPLNKDVSLLKEKERSEQEVKIVGQAPAASVKSERGFQSIKISKDMRNLKEASDSAHQVLRIRSFPSQDKAQDDEKSKGEHIEAREATEVGSSNVPLAPEEMVTLIEEQFNFCDTEAMSDKEPIKSDKTKHKIVKASNQNVNNAETVEDDAMKNNKSEGIPEECSEEGAAGGKAVPTRPSGEHATDTQSSEYILHPSVCVDEKLFLDILDKDFKDKLEDLFKSAISNNSDEKSDATMTKGEEVSASSILKLWKRQVEKGQRSWRDFHKTLMDFKCDAAGKRFRVVYEKYKLNSEKHRLIPLFKEKRNILQQLVSEGVLEVVEKTRMAARVDVKDYMDFFVYTLMSKGHEVLRKFHKFLYREGFPENWIRSLVLSMDDVVDARM